MKTISLIKRHTWSALLLLLFFALGSVATTSLNNISSNEPVWRDVEELLFPKKSSDPFFATDALLVIQNGQTLYEKYWNGNSNTSPHIAWSISKSLSSLILGVALGKGDLTLNDSVCKIAPQYLNKIDCKMTMDHLLAWSSGLSFLEAYESGGDPTLSSVGQMLYGDGKRDNVSFVLKHKQIYEPGTKYYYSTGDSNVVLGLLKYVYGDQIYKTLPQDFLFHPLDITTAGFEKDDAGHFQGGSSAYLSARDLARVGELMMNDGVWKGKRLLPEGWVNYLWQENPNWKGTVDESDKWIPLRHWWKPDLKALGLDQDTNFPHDVIAARGHWGQYLVIIPSRNMIIVRYGLDLEGRLDILELMKRVLKASKGVQ